MTRKLQDYVREAIRASSVEILRFNKESLKSMETRIRAVVDFQAVLCNEKFLELDGRFNEFQKEIHMLTKQEDAKQSYYMEEILEEIRELHTLVSKIISKNKGSFTATCLPNQIHDDASKSCSESRKEQEFVEDNHEETFHTSSFPYQIDTKASEICNKGQRELEVPEQNLHHSCIRLLKRQTVGSTDEIPVTSLHPEGTDAFEVGNDQRSFRKDCTSAACVPEENGLGADNDAFMTKFVGESETLVLNKPDVMEYGPFEASDVKENLEVMIDASGSLQEMANCKQTASWTSGCSTPERKATGAGCHNSDVWRTYPFIEDDDATCEKRGAACQGRVESPPKSRCATGKKTIEKHLNRPIYKRIRRCRRFSSVEIECLVKAVEKFGTGRWRDVKENYFSLAKDFSAGDLKDKWRSLVHSAHLAPQHRRCLKLTSLLANRILAIDDGEG